MERILLLIILGICVLGIGIIGAATAEKAVNRIFFYILLIAGATIIAIVPHKVESNTEKETAIKCLQGNNPYKMEIQYELKDSMYIPVDTIYVKIK